MAVSKVHATHASSTGVAFDQPAVLVGFYVSPGGTAGDVVLNDGGTGGTEKVRITLSSDSAGTDVNIPQGGIPFETDIAVSNLPTSSNVTLFYK